MTAVGRRVFLGMLGAGAAGIVLGDQAQRVLSGLTAPVTDRMGGGASSVSPLGRFRIYSVAGPVKERSIATYTLSVTGLVNRPLQLSTNELWSMTPTHLTKDFQCVTGWRVPDVLWTGVLLRDLLDQAGIGEKAKAVTFHSFDGIYTESLTLEQARRDDVLVAYEMVGRPVTHDHGGPVRLYVAPMYGYKSLKWLDSIEVTDRLEPGYWEVRGYDQHAWVGGSNLREEDPPI